MVYKVEKGLLGYQSQQNYKIMERQRREGRELFPEIAPNMLSFTYIMFSMHYAHTEPLHFFIFHSNHEYKIQKIYQKSFIVLQKTLRFLVTSSKWSKLPERHCYL